MPPPRPPSLPSFLAPHPPAPPQGGSWLQCWGQHDNQEAVHYHRWKDTKLVSVQMRAQSMQRGDRLGVRPHKELRVLNANVTSGSKPISIKRKYKRKPVPFCTVSVLKGDYPKPVSVQMRVPSMQRGDRLGVRPHKGLRMLHANVISGSKLIPISGLP